MPTTSLGPLLWFIAIIVMIPVALWLLKRTPLGGAGQAGLMRTVTSLQVSQSQRLMTVEVGQGADRLWLVLGVTPGSITTLHTMPPQAESAGPSPGQQSQAVNFSQMLDRLRKPGSPT